MYRKYRYLDGNQISCLEGLDNCTNLTELHMSNQAIPAGKDFQFDENTLTTLSVSLPSIYLGS